LRVLCNVLDTPEEDTFDALLLVVVIET
jgi:hypothetical protein